MSDITAIPSDEQLREIEEMEVEGVPDDELPD